MISLIPDRTARLPSGTLFSDVQAAACKYPERIAHLCRFLSWLGPLDALSREDQQILGLRAPNGRPLHAGELEDEPLDEAADEEFADAEPVTPAQGAGTQIAA